MGRDRWDRVYEEDDFGGAAAESDDDDARRILDGYITEDSVFAGMSWIMSIYVGNICLKTTTTYTVVTPSACRGLVEVVNALPCQSTLFVRIYPIFT
jgi:hypothetical protein